MRVLITGGAGFLGSVLTKELLDWKSEVSVINDNQWMSGTTERLSIEPVVTKLTVVDALLYNQCTIATFCEDSRYTFIRQDVTDPIKMKSLYDDHDVIIPLACYTGMPVCEAYKKFSYLVNYHVIKDMMEHIGDSKKIIFPCTNSGYGIGEKGKLITEKDPINPISVYGKTKVAAEKYVLSGKGVSLRLATVMGLSPFHRVGLLVNTFVYKAIKERVLTIYQGHYMRNYLNIHDFCQAVKLSLMNYDIMQGECFNVGDSQANLSKLQLAQEIAKYTEVHIIEVENMEDIDKRDYMISNEKIESMGFKPEWSLERTIKALIKFYKGVDERSGNVFFGMT